MIWVVGGHDHGSTLFRESADGLQTQHLVSHVQVGRGLIQKNDVGLLNQGSRQQHQLTFSAAQLRITSVFEMANAHAVERLLGQRHIPRRWHPENAHVGSSAHARYIENGEGEGRRMILKKKSYSAPPGARVESRQIVIAHAHGTFGEGQRAADAAKQGALSTSIGAENGEHFSGENVEVDRGK